MAVMEGENHCTCDCIVICYFVIRYYRNRWTEHSSSIYLSRAALHVSYMQMLRHSFRGLLMFTLSITPKHDSSYHYFVTHCANMVR